MPTGRLPSPAARFVEVGEAAAVIARHPGAEVETYARHLIMAGFVDSHVHYPQIDIIASYGEQLLAWLEKYTFPAEARFGDRGHADQAANRFLDECLRNGITTASVYCTVHPASVDAFCTAAQQRGFCMAAGKVMMDRNARDDLQDTAQARLRAVQGADRALAWRGPAHLRRHAALCRHLVAGPAGGGRRAVARASDRL